MKIKIREIPVGPVGSYVQLKDWKSGDKLWSDWIEKDFEYSKAIKGLDPKEEILPVGKYTLKIDYPLSTPFIEERELTKPMTREEVVMWIVDRYHFIYDVENETSKVKAGNIVGMYNRNNTDGSYGIWGHDLGDLALHTIYVDKNNVVTLGVDS